VSLSSVKRTLQRLPKWGAFALSFGALFAADGRAEKSEYQRLGTNSVPRSVGLQAVAMRIEGGKIYISQRGGDFEELPLGDTQQAAHLRELLREAGAAEYPVSVPVGSMIVANGGAAGDGKKPKEPDNGTASEKKQPDPKTKRPPTNDSSNGK
jgi:hypothetical protein